MNAITAIKASGAPLNGLTLKLSGKGAAARSNAFIRIAVLAVSETQSRADTIANLKLALGNAPQADQIAIAKGEWIIGRATVRMPAGELPKGCTDIADKLNYVRRVVELFAAPPKEGTTARPVKKWQEGRRTATQHKVIRAAEEAWSVLLAETGIGGAKTQEERKAGNSTKRAPSMAGSGKGKASTPPTHSALVTPAAPVTADEAVAHIVAQAVSLLQYANKHAALLPTEFAASVKRFNGAILQLDGDRRTAK